MSEGKHYRPEDEAAAGQKSGMGAAPAGNSREGQVSQGRRRFTKAGLLVPPVLMSVASRPVFGAQCLSNMLSGNLSNPDRGFCETAPFVEWRNADNWPTVNNSVMGCAGSVNVVPDTRPNNDFPQLCSECQNGQGVWQENQCTGGTPFNDVFCTSNKTDSMYRILCMEPDTDEAACVKALLYSLTNPNYPLRPMQVQDLCAGAYSDFVSHFGGIKAYLETTWGF